MTVTCAKNVLFRNRQSIITHDDPNGNGACEMVKRAFMTENGKRDQIEEQPSIARWSQCL